MILLERMFAEIELCPAQPKFSTDGGSELSSSRQAQSGYFIQEYCRKLGILYFRLGGPRVSSFVCSRSDTGAKGNTLFTK
jgi:hypothetical protein